MPSPAASSSKRAEAQGAEAGAQRLRQASRSACPGRANARRRAVPPGRGDAGELLEERDHVQEHDEVEAPSRERQGGGVGDVEAHPAGELGRKQPPGLVDHVRREVDADDLGLRVALGDQPGGRAGAGADVENVRGLASRRSRAAASGASQTAPRPPSQLGAPAGRTGCAAVRGKSATARAWRRPPASAKRAKRGPTSSSQAAVLTRAAESRSSCPTPAPNISRGVSLVDGERDVSVRVLVQDDVPAPHLGERPGRDRVVALEADLDLDARARHDPGLLQMLGGQVELDVAEAVDVEDGRAQARSDRRPAAAAPAA